LIKKKVVVISSTRADFNYLKIILEKINESSKLELFLIVTGIHLLKKYGRTIKIIEKSRIPIARKIEMYDQIDNDETALSRAIGRGLINFAKAFNKIKPDILLVLGDRFEPLAAVIAASTLNIPIAHIHGGDNVPKGQIDELIRHAITKFSHIHFPATDKSAQRIKLMGEEDWRIHMVGSPSLDLIYQQELLSLELICKELNLDPSREIVICLLHPYTIRSEKSGEYMKTILDVLKDLQLQSVIIYPNNDPGSDLIIEQIEKNRNIEYFRIIKNLRSNIIYSLMKNANLLIGNSSSGIIESAIFKLPVVNIGDRNAGRESGKNVIHTIFKFNEIKNAIKKGLTKDFQLKCQNIKNLYGNGTASEKIIKILEEIRINDKLLIKKLTYEL